MREEWFTVKETAEKLGVNRRTVCGWVAQRKGLGAYAKRIDGIYHLPRESIENYLTIVGKKK